jgi:hypothetical protein
MIVTPIDNPTQKGNNYRNSQSNQHEVPNHTGLSTWLEIPDYLFINGIYNRKLHPMIYSKETHEVFHLSNNSDLGTFGISNDLDGGAPYWPSRYIDGIQRKPI